MMFSGSAHGSSRHGVLCNPEVLQTQAPRGSFCARSPGSFIGFALLCSGLVPGCKGIPDRLCAGRLCQERAAAARREADQAKSNVGLRQAVRQDMRLRAKVGARALRALY